MKPNLVWLSVVLCVVVAVGVRLWYPKPIRMQSAAPSSPNILNNQGSVSFTSSEPLAPPEPEYVQKLRAMTTKRGLSFKVYCWENSSTPDEDIYAVAWISTDKFGGVFIEDGAGPEWIKTGPTQEIAIRRLLVALQGSPTWTPEHKASEKPGRKHRECPPEIQGGPQ